VSQFEVTFVLRVRLSPPEPDDYAGRRVSGAGNPIVVSANGVLMTCFPRSSRVVVLLIVGSLCGTSGAGEPQVTQDLASRVRSIFLAKCSECHGRSLSRPRAALYLHELGQVASNREWVVPYEPENSYLWTLARNDDMPAKGAKAGPLSPQEKEIVRAWIAAGAPVPKAQRSSAPVPLPHDSVGADPSPLPFLRGEETSDVATAPATPSLSRILAWIGKFHVLVIHFPIALLATAALVEILAAWRGDRIPEAMVRVSVLLGTAGALAAVTLGWLHADLGGQGSGGVLTAHRWLGTAGGLWSLAVVLLSEWDSRRGHRSLLFRLVLWIGAFLVAITAHFGGLLVHGSRFFDW
jgi:uncharacterized membrane protein/mono/diheme cytochrome c family protein